MKWIGLKDYYVTRYTYHSITSMQLYIDVTFD